MNMFPDQPISMDEGGRKIANLARIARDFPLGQPLEVSITLSDEEWMAVMLVVSAMLTHQQVEDAPRPFPDWVIEKSGRAVRHIRQVSDDVLKMLYMEREMDK